jgi:hypothetical protein
MKKNIFLNFILFFSFSTLLNGQAQVPGVGKEAYKTSKMFELSADQLSKIFGQYTDLVYPKFDVDGADDVYLMMKNKIVVFDRTGKILKTFEGKDYGLDDSEGEQLRMAVDEDGNMVLYYYDIPPFPTIFLDHDGKLIRKIKNVEIPDGGTAAPRLSKGVFYSPLDGKIFYSSDPKNELKQTKFIRYEYQPPGGYGPTEEFYKEHPEYALPLGVHPLIGYEMKKKLKVYPYGQGDYGPGNMVAIDYQGNSYVEYGYSIYFTDGIDSLVISERLYKYDQNFNVLAVFDIFGPGRELYGRYLMDRQNQNLELVKKFKKYCPEIDVQNALGSTGLYKIDLETRSVYCMKMDLENPESQSSKKIEFFKIEPKGNN